MCKHHKNKSEWVKLIFFCLVNWLVVKKNKWNLMSAYCHYEYYLKILLVSHRTWAVDSWILYMPAFFLFILFSYSTSMADMSKNVARMLPPVCYFEAPLMAVFDDLDMRTCLYRSSLKTHVFQTPQPSFITQASSRATETIVSKWLTNTYMDMLGFFVIGWLILNCGHNVTLQMMKQQHHSVCWWLELKGEKD